MNLDLEEWWDIINLLQLLYIFSVSLYNPYLSNHVKSTAEKQIDKYEGLEISSIASCEKWLSYGFKKVTKFAIDYEQVP
jgi:hypothetical protein